MKITETSIDNYDKWKENQEKIEYLSNPIYKIYELKIVKSVNTLKLQMLNGSFTMKSF